MIHNAARNKGFSFFEILIVLIVIAILSVIAIPLYSQHLVKERRLEAAVTLNKLAVALEQYYVVHQTYKDAPLGSLGFADFIAENNYELQIVEATDSGFKVAAKPLLAQSKKDYSCGTLSLNSAGERLISGPGKMVECW